MTNSLTLQVYRFNIALGLPIKCNITRDRWNFSCTVFSRWCELVRLSQQARSQSTLIGGGQNFRGSNSLKCMGYKTMLQAKRADFLLYATCDILGYISRK